MKQMTIKLTNAEANHIESLIEKTLMMEFIGESKNTT